MRRHAGRRLAALLAALLVLGGCVGDGAPRTAAEREKDTCQHTSEGGQARTVCY